MHTKTNRTRADALQLLAHLLLELRVLAMAVLHPRGHAQLDLLDATPIGVVALMLSLRRTTPSMKQLTDRAMYVPGFEFGPALS